MTLWYVQVSFGCVFAVSDNVFAQREPGTGGMDDSDFSPLTEEQIKQRAAAFARVSVDKIALWFEGMLIAALLALSIVDEMPFSYFP